VVRTISLTFDNGPEPAVTDFVLDTLASRFSNDFPPSCVVLERGVPRETLDTYVSASPVA
jgi:hypothetical protein